MTVSHLYRMLRFWALAGLPSWGILVLAKYLGIWKLPYWPLLYLGIATIIAVAGLLVEERLSAEVTVEIPVKKEEPK